MSDASMQLLIVEDDESTGELYLEMFEKDNTLEVRWAKTYEGAKNEIQKRQFDIIIMDLSLSEEPNRSFEGIQLVQELSSWLMPPSVIVATGFRDKVKTNPDFPRDFIFYTYEKTEPIVQLREAVHKAKQLKRVQKLLIAGGKSAAGAMPVTNELRRMLEQFVKLTKAYVCHLLLPTEDRLSLEIVVDTGDDEGRQVKINDSVTGEAFETRKLINLPDSSRHPKYKMIRGREEMKSELAVPLLIDSKAIGVLNIESEAKNAFSSADEELMTTFGRYVVATLQSDHRRLDLQDLLGTTTSQLLESVIDLDKVFEAILERGCKLIEADRGFVALVEGDQLKTQATTEEKVWPKGSTLDISKSVCGQAVHRGYAINIFDVTQGPYKQYYQPTFGNLKSELVVPLWLEGKVIGVLNFESAGISAFTSEDQRVLVALASQASIAIRITKELEARRQAERSQTVADLAAGLSHNVRSPADGICFDVTRIRDKYASILVDNVKLANYLDRIERAAIKIQNVPQQIAERVEQYKPPILMDFKTLVLPRLERLREKEQIPDTIDIQIDESINNHIAFRAYEEHTPVVIDNLIMNAIEAMQGNGIIKISQEIREKSHTMLRIEDNGPGIPPQLSEAVFDRDYTDKDGGGVGLWWVRRHLSRLNATIEVIKSSLGGASFVISFPISG